MCIYGKIECSTFHKTSYTLFLHIMDGLLLYLLCVDLKKLDFTLLDMERFLEGFDCQTLAEPWGYKGGTLVWVPPDPPVVWFVWL